MDNIINRNNLDNTQIIYNTVKSNTTESFRYDNKGYTKIIEKLNSDINDIDSILEDIDVEILNANIEYERAETERQKDFFKKRRNKLTELKLLTLTIKKRAKKGEARKALEEDDKELDDVISKLTKEVLSWKE